MGRRREGRMEIVRPVSSATFLPRAQSAGSCSCVSSLVFEGNAVGVLIVCPHSVCFFFCYLFDSLGSLERPLAGFLSDSGLVESN